MKQVPARGNKRIPSQPPLPAQLPLSNRYGALECEGPATEDMGEGEAPSGGLPRTSQSAPRITTASAKKKRRVIVIGNSLLREQRARSADQTHPTGKSAASLGPGLGMLLRNCLV